MNRHARRGTLTIMLTAILVGVCVPMATADNRETTEWCNIRWMNANDASLPRVLLIGDSISVGYHGAVGKELKGVAHVDNLATSKAITDPALAKEIAYVLGEYRYAVIHFNNGLHGWHVTEAEYEAGLRALVAQLRKLGQGAKLVWASSTPIPSRTKGQKLHKTKNKLVLARNAIAAKVMAECKIPTNDLYELMVVDLDNLTASKGNVHYGNKGKELQGKAIAKVIRAAMGK